jgi:hypothetical protein
MILAMLAATVLLADSTTALQAASTPATPATQATAAAQPAKKPAGSQADLICKSEPVLGSRMPVRKCHTSAQAQQDKLDAQADLERAQGANANNPH